MRVYAKSISDSDYVYLADFKHAVRRAFEFRAGATASVGRFSECFCWSHSAVGGLAECIEIAGTINRQQSDEERISAPQGESELEILTQVHRHALRQVGRLMHDLFQELSWEEAR